ncbi:hypothetical protein ACQ859_16595 [Roseateles chitinivorans]|uniref:hypothetical protein n=1 Tax=Roseateles chitinivorans TaxID=2917965 RepID=UPI003D66FF47
MSYISAMNRVARFRPRLRGIASLEGMEGLGYSCWIDPEDRRIPVFALEVGLRIAAECSCPMYGVRYDRLRLTFREFSDQEWGLVADCPRACPDFIAPDGARVHAIGFWHGWAWDVAAIFAEPRSVRGTLRLRGGACARGARVCEIGPLLTPGLDGTDDVDGSGTRSVFQAFGLTADG